MEDKYEQCDCGEEFRAFGHFEAESKITWCTKCKATYKDGRMI